MKHNPMEPGEAGEVRAVITVICNDADYFLRHRLAVVEKLAELQYSVSVITGGRKIGLAEQRGWKHIFRPIERFSFRVLSDLGLTLSAFLHFRSERPDAVQLITLKPAVFSGIAAVFSRWMYGSPRRILITIPGLGRLMSPATNTYRKSAVARNLVERVIRFLSSCADVRFTFETNEDRNHWLRLGLITERNSVVIHGAGVDPGLFHPPDPRTSPTHPIKILFASRLLKSKGLDAFIETARQLSCGAECEFIVAGMVEPHDPDGFPTDRLAGEKSIRFLGEVKDMPELLRQVDLVCLPTRYGEGIPRILIEAAATGLPCLATDVAGCREIIRDGVNGKLFAVAEASAMAEAMRNAVKGYLLRPALLKEHGQAALKTFDTGCFDQRSVVDRFVTLLISTEA